MSWFKKNKKIVLKNEEVIKYYEDEIANVKETLKNKGTVLVTFETTKESKNVYPIR